ncbi:hypothetical protein J0J19_23235, partial [Vibrio vulnificus]|uniref:hypothetical protein n=1 Tax=Vibrio vulnificus TaxID=672 RepID=UPI0019D4EB62
SHNKPEELVNINPEIEREISERRRNNRSMNRQPNFKEGLRAPGEEAPHEMGADPALIRRNGNGHNGNGADGRQAPQPQRIIPQ